MTECKHNFFKEWIDNNIYWRCSKCNYIWKCKHEWNYEINRGIAFYKCSKCLIDAMFYKCSNCGHYTPHWFYEIKGQWQSINFEYKQYGILEEYKCLMCGNTKIIRYGGKFTRMR
jgi:hypothetical protein